MGMLVAFAIGLHPPANRFLIKRKPEYRHIDFPRQGGFKAELLVSDRSEV